jgi:sec-independent protein translocase protein TatC
VLAFGLMFQMPVVLSLLGRVGIVSASALRKGRRYAIVGIAAFSALVTPNDVISMFVMAVPVYALYEISIWIVAAIEASRSKREKAEAEALAAADVHPPGP